MDIKRYSEAEVLEDYRTGMQMVADQLQVLVGKQAAAGIAGLSADQLADVRPDFSSSTQILDSEGARLLGQVYRFAILGKLSGWLAEELDDNAIQRWETIFSGLRTCASADWGGAIFEKCLHALRVARVRVCFMPDTHVFSFAKQGKEFVQGCIHLSELAVLSGLEEKTLRNMGAATHKQYLPTIKRGARTYVALSVALPWLDARGFAPIVFDEPSEKRDLRINPFYSGADMANFVRERGEDLGLLGESKGQTGTVDQALVDGISVLVRGEVIQNAALLEKLAALLYPSEPKDFVEAAANIGVMAAQLHSS